jgi:hypothetical protein
MLADMQAIDPVDPESPGGDAAVHALFPALYAELRRLARSRLAAGARPTLLDTASLVHEAYCACSAAAGWS